MTSDQKTIARIHRNALALLGGDVLNKASTFLVYAMLARHADARQFGQLSLGLLLLYTFHVFAAAGLPTSIARSVARRPKCANRLLAHGYLAALVPSALAVVGMLLFAWVMRYSQDTVVVISLLSFAILPYALTMITEAVIRGRQHMHLIAVANIPGNCGMVLAGLIVLRLGYGVTVLALVVVLARFATLSCMHAAYRWSFERARAARRVRWGLAWRMLRRSMVFLGSDGVNVIWTSLDALILSKFATEREIGLLSASFQLLQPILVFYRSVGHSSFPALCAAAKSGPEQVAQISHRLIAFLLRLSFPAAIATWALAPFALATVYGNAEFADGAIALQILAATLLLDIVCPVLGHGLWAMSREKIVLRIVVTNLLINALVGTALISQFGLTGAAVSVLISSCVNVAQHYWYFRRDVPSFSLRATWVGMLPAGLAMMLAVVCLPDFLHLNVAVGLLVYFALAFPSWWQPYLRLSSSEMRGPIAP